MGTIAFIWLQTALMILFAKEFLPNDMSHVWKNMFKEKKKPLILTHEERTARFEAHLAKCQKEELDAIQKRHDAAIAHLRKQQEASKEFLNKKRGQ